MENIQLSNPIELEALRQKLKETYQAAASVEGLEGQLIAAMLATLLGAAYARPASLVEMGICLKEFNASEILRIKSVLN